MPSKREKNRAQQKGKPIPARQNPAKDALSSENLGVGSAVAALGWGVVSLVLKMPELLVVGGTTAVGMMGVAQTVKTKFESRRQRRKRKGDKE
jgi:hypothetical protein